MDVPLLTWLRLSNAGMRFCIAHPVPHSVPSNYSVDDCLSVRYVIANEKSDTSVSDSLKEVELLGSVITYEQRPT